MGLCAFVCVCQGQVSVLRTVPDFLKVSLALAQGSPSSAGLGSQTCTPVSSVF